MNRITGRSAFLALLKDEGITHLFGNPGTTELPIMHALKDHPDLTYVMAMQESLVVAIADGYSRASGKLVACNVHVAPGLGNAMGSLFNASFTGTPMILTAGQQEQGHGLMEPVLYGPLVQMAEPLVKWAVEVTRLEDLPRIVRRAAKIATTPPTGPVFISLPGDILNAEAGIELGRSTRVDTRVRPSDEVAAGAGAAHPESAKSRHHHRRRDRQERRAAGSRRIWRKRWVRPPTSARRPTARISCRRARASWARCRGCRSRCARCCRPTISMIVLGADPLADVGLQRDRSAAGGHADRADRPGRLGSRQELQRRDRAEGRREGNPARAGAGAEVGRRRARSRARAKQGIAALASKNWTAKRKRAGRADFEDTAPARRSIRTGWRCRWSRRCPTTPSWSTRA